MTGADALARDRAHYEEIGRFIYMFAFIQSHRDELQRHCRHADPRIAACAAELEGRLRQLAERYRAIVGEAAGQVPSGEVAAAAGEALALKAAIMELLGRAGAQEQ
ncbi:hypothetical protein [Massilia horti]|uniref:Uncharacterized protein n=1 Tax=Massilia horti TaxID=2562153 RepID=A0A4Y9SUG6_9BURK|nr:hypothetical protein [Massilia horti]TFW28396.1 hypothetical protein E4O92_21465 [Massilia horti]